MGECLSMSDAAHTGGPKRRLVASREAELRGDAIPSRVGDRALIRIIRVIFTLRTILTITKERDN